MSINEGEVKKFEILEKIMQRLALLELSQEDRKVLEESYQAILDFKLTPEVMALLEGDSYPDNKVKQYWMNLDMRNQGI